MSPPQSNDSPTAQARQKLKAKDLPAAIEILKQAVEQSSEDAAVFELLGMCHFSAKQYSEAKVAFEKVTRLTPQIASGWVNLGATQNVLQDFTAASKSLRKALKNDRQSSSAYYNLGIAQKGLKMNSNAVSAYQEAIRIEPKLAEAYANLANMFIDMKNNKQAIRTLEAGQKECPKDRKIAVLLKKVMGLTDEAKRAVAPLGRLVNEVELAKKQICTGKRDLTSRERQDERNLLKTRSKSIRDSVPEMISLLDHDLTQQIHVLHLAALQKDDRGDGVFSYGEMTETLETLGTWRSESSAAASEIRTHLERTDPGL
ncbi:MAG: tetratricopeptide repeat protein [Fuerstiella sp.]